MTISNISSKATGPFVTKFHVEPPWMEGRKVCSNSPLGQLTNMPPCLFISETLKNLFLSNQWNDCLEIRYVVFGTGVITVFFHLMILTLDLFYSMVKHG